MMKVIDIIVIDGNGACSVVTNSHFWLVKDDFVVIAMVDVVLQ